MDNFIIEKVNDLSFDPEECPISHEVRKIWLQLLKNNPILNNGQMVCIKLTDELKNRMFDYCQKILMEFIESEKLLKECNKMREQYILQQDNINNTNSYVKNIFNIIVNMDRVYKYIWNITKKLVDNVESYKEYIEWQEKTTHIKEEVGKRWDLIYKIRNEIEHPKTLKTTMFARVNGGSVIPQIIYNGKNYDLLEIAKDSLQCMCIYFSIFMQAAILNSKYVVAFTDESRRHIYRAENYPNESNNS